MDRSYSVYRHIFPTGETYVGITNGKVEDRWNNGFGYESQRHFFKRIVATGWDNIRHEVVETDLDEKTARKMEKELIARDHEKSLNVHHREGVDLSWTKDVVANDNLEVRKHKFRGMNDIWLNKVRHRDTVPFDWVIYDDHIDFQYFIDDNGLYYDVLRVPIPEGVTYSGLYHYLYWKLDFSQAVIMGSVTMSESILSSIAEHMKEVSA